MKIHGSVRSYINKASGFLLEIVIKKYPKVRCIAFMFMC